MRGRVEPVPGDDERLLPERHAVRGQQRRDAGTVQGGLREHAGTARVDVVREHGLTMQVHVINIKSPTRHG